MVVLSGIVSLLPIDTSTWIISLAYIIIIWPAGMLVGKATTHWRDEIEGGDEPGVGQGRTVDRPHEAFPDPYLRTA